MQTLQAIAQRRSIRKFHTTPVADALITRLLEAAIQSPSGKNRQPWRFIVVKEDKRAEMIRVLRAGFEKLKAQGVDLGSAEWTAQVMERAPVTIFIFNSNQENAPGERTMLDLIINSVDVQSIGAAIQNLLLAACDCGLGTLWICDVFYAYEDLCEWFGETHQMIAAVSVGYADEQPAARPRQAVADVTRWW